MEQNGLQPRDLIPFIGSRNRVHEVLNRRRPLTLKMIWRLHRGYSGRVAHQAQTGSRRLTGRG
jgi:antitoxin component HigA of HigAB toxin-antitoxin module